VGLMKKYPGRKEKFLTKAEYANYLEAMKQHAIETRHEGVLSKYIKDQYTFEHAL
jgi:ATP-dependent DNA ligase